jgi:hypothetical protein
VLLCRGKIALVGQECWRSTRLTDMSVALRFRPEKPGYATYPFERRDVFVGLGVREWGRSSRPFCLLLYLICVMI